MAAGAMRERRDTGSRGSGGAPSSTSGRLADTGNGGGCHEREARHRQQGQRWGAVVNVRTSSRHWQWRRARCARGETPAAGAAVGRRRQRQDVYQTLAMAVGAMRERDETQSAGAPGHSETVNGGAVGHGQPASIPEKSRGKWNSERVGRVRGREYEACRRAGDTLRVVVVEE